MSRAHDLHIIRRGQSRRLGRSARRKAEWYITRSGRTLSEHRTQKYAMTVGRRLACRTGVDLVTHGRDGRIRSKDSYGNESSKSDSEH